MKSLIAVMALGLMMNTASAFTLGIVDMDAPDAISDSYLVYASDGKLYEISQDDKELVDLAVTALEEKLEVEVELSATANSEDLLEMRNEITKISLSTKELDQVLMTGLSSRNKDLNDPIAALKNSYVTDFDSEYDATGMFNTQRNDTTMRSECYNRAHVWSWELNKKHYNGRKVQVGKIWIFFTKQYIRAYRHKWWFHISPYVTVNNDLRVMDRSFNQKPTTEKDWTDKFIKSKQACTEIYKYTDYEDYQYSAHCYVIKSSVFYWQPWQVENVEKKNQGRTEWNAWEVKKSYRQAIGWFTRVP